MAAAAADAAPGLLLCGLPGRSSACLLSLMRKVRAGTSGSGDDNVCVSVLKWPLV